MPQLKLHLLGSPYLERDGEPLSMDTRKAIALGSYLAITGQPQTRDTLAALLWPELDESRAKAALRRTLSSLRTALADGWLKTDGELVRLVKDGQLWIDVDEFRDRLAATALHGHAPGQVCPLCLAPLTEAVKLYSGDFMAGFSLTDSADFDHWQFFQAESLRQMYTGALARLVEGYHQEGDLERAIGHVQRWLQADPLDEAAHQEAMRLYAEAGQRSAALRQYQECVRLLQSELGVPPSAETAALNREIEQNRLAVAGQGRDRHTTISSLLPETNPRPGPSELPLVGRLAEWSALQHHHAAIRHTGRFILLEGEAGIGKTRLAEEFLAHVERQGAHTLIARCYAGESDLAYGPFVEGLRLAFTPEILAELQALKPRWLSDLFHLFPELHEAFPGLPEPSPLNSPGAQSRFFQALSELVAHLLARTPAGVLFLDDLHWADASSIELLGYLARRLARQPYCILATCRSGESDSQPRLRHLLSETQRQGTALHLPLDRLDLKDVAALVASNSVTNVTVPEEMIQQLYVETEGLPFFVAEYVKAIATGMPLAEIEQSMAEGMHNLFYARLADLPEPAQQFLATAAAIGRSFEFETAWRSSGCSESETVAALETLLARGIVRGEGASYDFSHEKLRQLVYTRCSAPRRRLLHRRLAETLCASGTAGAGQLAYHFRLAGEDQQAAHFYQMAGEQARRLYANAEALSHFRMALELGHPRPGLLHEAIGELEMLRGEYPAALRSFQRAAAEEASSHIDYNLGELYHRVGEWTQAEAHFQRGLEQLPSQSNAGDAARFWSAWSHTALQRGDGERALTLAQRALALAQAADEPRALAQVYNILGIIAKSTGDLAAARLYLEESRRRAEALHDGVAQVAALNNLALLCAAEGRLDEALAQSQSALQECITLGDRHRAAALHNTLADLFHQSGRNDEAMGHLKQAVAIFAEIGGDLEQHQPEIWKLVEW
jgi:DNA-binding SARP family transcriptional activator